MNQKILEIVLPSEQYAFLQQKAIVQQKEVAQLGLEIIRNWLRQQTEIEENITSESKNEAVHEVTTEQGEMIHEDNPLAPFGKGEAERSEQVLETAYREYYADAEDDLRIIRNMRSAQMRAFQRNHREKN
jgi:hypothetical protein